MSVKTKWKVNRDGDIERPDHKHEIAKKYRPDNPMDQSVVPYLIMLLCAAVDAVMFINLFMMISYDSPLMVSMEVLGFLIAFDVVPIYLGIHWKRVKQGVSKDKGILAFGVAVFAMGCITNIVLRIYTIDLVAPDLSASSTSFLGAVQVEAASKITPAAVALTIFGCVQPIITSIGSFFVGYICFDPLAVRAKKEEEQIVEKQVELQQYKSALKEYAAMPDFKAHLQTCDDESYDALLHATKAQVLSYCDYVRLKLMEHLSNPASTDRLTQVDCDRIMTRLEAELKAIGIFRDGSQQGTSRVYIGVKMPTTSDAAVQ